MKRNLGLQEILIGVFLAIALAVALGEPVRAQEEENENEKAKRVEATRASEDKATKQDLLLIMGRQSTLDLKFDPCKNLEECIKVANNQLVRVQYSADKRQLVFTPTKKGETTITVRDQKGNMRLIMSAVVVDNNLERKAAELKVLLRDIEGIDIKIMGDKIVIDGEVVVISDLNRLYTVLNDESYRGSVLSLVGVSPVGMQIMAERIQSEINRPNIKVRPFNGLFLIEGQVESVGEGSAIKQIALSMLQGFVLPRIDPQDRGPIDVRRQKVNDPIIMRVTVAQQKPPPPEKMIRVTVDFVELSKDYLRNFGFSWIPSLEGNGGSIQFGQSTTGGVTSAGSGSLSGTIGNLFPKLNSAQNAGYARILEESIMIVKSGQLAKFGRLLKLPIQVTSAQGQSDFKTQDVGPEIEVTPKVVGQTEDVDMNIQFGYKGLAGKQGNAFITLNHSYRSQVIVKNGESAAIVNALSNTIATAFNKDPPGGSVPANPLFTLLRSKAFQKNKTQFVVFLTPQIIESSSTGTEDIKNKYGLKRKK